MSKAFLRESDFDEIPHVPAPVAVLPAGAKNYLTPAGARRLQAQLARLVDEERPPLAASAHDAETKRELQALDQRIRYLEQSLRSAEIVPPPVAPDDVVRFGAEVAVREPDGTESLYRLVGADEAAPENGAVSWLSPIAQALLHHRRGDRVRFQTPAGTRELEIVAVRYSTD